MPQFSAPVLAAIAGVAGNPSLLLGEVEDIATGLESVPVYPVSTSFPIIIQVISPIPNGQMSRVHAAPIMTKVSDNLMAVDLMQEP
ncbi:hypothetical protein ASD8599_03089 [Ascidiaceihabitans donghaensis]|uniref:Biopterin-dependent aromatic amino acid hydroxylase family profile domain-containing protein n=1 Tax=Ascidiaceihabitans donghaensis TaxID=1510460 RepID=A0A2R8BH64_9RHOB|nr:hypothetical protein [Ascidiaceihabitans donghaensis]SPH22345.1 hypothetical protein ASD8599_03089 [Ascidiaceihabitans donghaensis]